MVIQNILNLTKKLSKLQSKFRFYPVITVAGVYP